jgi:hypothetical protein
MFRKVLACLLLAAFIAMPAMAQNRVNASEKGSLLIWSKVELRWNAAGAPIQDVFIDLTNDYIDDVIVQLYFINGDGPLDATAVERAHPGWNSVDVAIPLTMNEPTYWSAMTGGPIGMQPFTILDPAGPGQLPGRPDPEGTGDRVLRGYIIGWAVNDLGQEIRWNHLKGDAVIVNYLYGSAWEYNAWSFRALDQGGAVLNGDPTGTQGQLFLNGVEYDFAYSQLLLDFYAVNSTALSGGGRVVSVDTDLTLFPVSVDLRQETDGPITTKAHFDIWDMNEFKKSETYHCVTCWDQTLLSRYGIPNNFLIQNLQTDKGKARITGQASQLCDFDFDPADGPLGTDPRDIISVADPLLGVAAKRLVFDAGVDFGWAGMNLFGMGTASALVQADLVSGGNPPPELPAGIQRPVQTNTPRQTAGAIGPK